MLLDHILYQPRDASEEFKRKTFLRVNSSHAWLVLEVKNSRVKTLDSWRLCKTSVRNFQLHQPYFHLINLWKTQLAIPFLMATIKRTFLNFYDNGRDFQLLYIEMAKEQPAFSLKRRNQDNKNSDSSSIRDEGCISYTNIQVPSSLMEKTAFQILIKCRNLHTHTRTLTCTYTAYRICLQKLLQTGLGDRRKRFWSAIVLPA